MLNITEYLYQYLTDNTLYTVRVEEWGDTASGILLQDQGGSAVVNQSGQTEDQVAVYIKHSLLNTARDMAGEVYDLFKNYGGFGIALPAPRTGLADIVVARCMPVQRPYNVGLTDDHYTYTFNLQLTFLDN